MANVIKQAGFFSDIPPIIKGIIALAVTGTVVFVGYKVYKKLNVSKQDKEDKAREKEQEKLEEKEQKNLEKKLSPSYLGSEYITFANDLFKSFDGCLDFDLGVNSYTKAVNILLSMKNDLDVSKLIDAYGTRQRTCNVLGLHKVDVSGKDGLFTTIRNVWSNPIFSKIKSNINNNWANKNIKNRI